MSETPLTKLASPRQDIGDASAESLAAVIAEARRLRQTSQFEKAAKLLEGSLASSPSSFDMWCELGLVQLAAKEFLKAKEAFERALALEPKSAEVHRRLGQVNQELGQFDDAIIHLQKVIELHPDNPSGHNNLGIIYAERRQFAEAINCYNKALEIVPEYACAWNNLGNVLGYLGRPDESIAAFHKALAIKPDYIEAHNNLGVAFVQLEDHGQALAHYNKATLLSPDYSEAHMNRGLQSLLLGKFEEGWADYEWRWKGKGAHRRTYRAKRWDGSPLVGKRILVHYEQGIGDTLQFIRYVTELKARGATVFVECQKPLCKLLSRTPGIDLVVHRDQKMPRFDFYSPMLSLPGLFQANLETIPCNVPYVFTHPELLPIWKERLLKMPGYKVGIAWQGNPAHRGDWKRSIPLKSFEPLSQIEGVTLVSLQHGFGKEQLKETNEFEVVNLEGIGNDEDGFLRTAAIIKNLDLVITADTSVAHLAGAMGVPVWVAISTSCDWRWLQNREDSPWYPTLRLFRQVESGNWANVFECLTHALRKRMSFSGPNNPDETAQRQSRELAAKACDLLGSNEIVQAETILREAVQIDTTNAKAHHDLGVVYGRQNREADSIACFRRSLELDPSFSSAYANLGLALYNIGQHEDAVGHLRRAIRLGASAPEVHNNLGVALAQLGELSSARSSYLAALHLRPDYAIAHFNLSHVLLAEGKYEQAWIEFEWRRRLFAGKNQQRTEFRWTGELLPGKTILIRTERSFVDTLQFVRFAALAKKVAGRVVVECQPSLVKLLARCPYIDEVFPDNGGAPKCDVQVALMSVPAIVSFHAKAPIPLEPYLFADPVMIEDWSKRLMHLKGRRIGIAWHEHPQKHGMDNVVKLERFARLARDRNVALISLGQGVEQGLLEQLGENVNLASMDGIEEGDKWLRLAAIIMNLDLVITVDTAIAHLAGALGVPTWVLLPRPCDWRWLGSSDETPWYPKMRLFRQRTYGQWDSVFEKIGEELKAFASAPGEPTGSTKSSPASSDDWKRMNAS